MFSLFLNFFEHHQRGYRTSSSNETAQNQRFIENIALMLFIRLDFQPKTGAASARILKLSFMGTNFCILTIKKWSLDFSYN